MERRRENGERRSEGVKEKYNIIMFITQYTCRMREEDRWAYTPPPLKGVRRGCNVWEGTLPGREGWLHRERMGRVRKGGYIW